MTKLSPKKNKRPVLNRVDKNELPPFEMTSRDIEILWMARDFRAMTAPQVEAAYFTPAKPRANGQPMTNSRCLHRLKALYHHGYLDREEPEQSFYTGRKPMVYFLAKQGAVYLAKQADVTVSELGWSRFDRDVGRMFLEHLVIVNDIRVAVMLATRAHQFTLEQWLDERDLKRAHTDDMVTITDDAGKKQSTILIPDGYFLLDTPERRYHQFLEVDRGTETGRSGNSDRRTWARKIKAYLAYYNSRKYQNRYHTDSMRVLTITTGERRLANLKRITEDVGGKARFWFTTFERLAALGMTHDEKARFWRPIIDRLCSEKLATLPDLTTRTDSQMKAWDEQKQSIEGFWQAQYERLLNDNDDIFTGPIWELAQREGLRALTW